MNGRSGRVASINVSAGGVPKEPVQFAKVNVLGLEGDAHRSSGHGGPERAICLYSLELINLLREEGHPVGIGTTGENLTIEGMDWSLMVPGAPILVGGEVRLEVTSFTNPCKTIRASFSDERFSRISQKLFPGWSRVYARVAAGGELRVGDPLTLS